MRRTFLPLFLLAITLSSGLADTQSRRVPANATADSLGRWTCNDGYLKRAEACVTVADATDEEIKEHLVARSIAAYTGSCACPFNMDRAGRRSGARRASSRPGGASPMCCAADVSEAAVRAFRTMYPKK